MLLPNGRQQFLDGNGNPLAGGSVGFYIPGTLTLKTVWSDQGQATPLPNPVPLDGAGEPSTGSAPCGIFGRGLYRQIVKDAFGQTVWDQLTQDDYVSDAMLGFIQGTSVASATALLTYTAYNSTTRGVVGKLLEQLSILDFGALSTASNNTAALSAVGNTGQVIVPPGTYAVGGDVTLSVPVAFMSGARFNIASGKTISFNGGFAAPREQVFSGAGKVTFAAEKAPDAFPEWWGGIPNVATLDCAPALNAAIVACPRTILACGTYYTQGTVLHQTSGRSVVGALGNAPQGDTSPAPTIMLTNGTSDIYQIGPNSYSGTLQSTNSLKDVILARNVAPVIASGCLGVKLRFTVWTELEEVFSYDSMGGINLAGNAQTRLNHCVVTRYVAGTGGGTDSWTGIGINGDFDIGLAGGNASIYIDGCVVGTGISGSGSGIVLYGTYGFSDVFVTQLETAQLAYGAVLLGNGNRTTTKDVQEENVRFVDCTFDTSLAAGFYMKDLSAYASIEINGGYIGIPPTGSGPIGFYGTNCAGSVRISNTEVILVQNTAAIGLVLVNCSNWDSSNVAYLEGGYGGGVFTLTGVTDSTFRDRFVNNSAVAPGVAVQMAGTCDHVQMDIAMTGRAGAHTYGYSVPSTVKNSLFDCSRINPVAILATPGKLLYNGVTVISAAGTVFGTGNLPIGVMT